MSEPRDFTLPDDAQFDFSEWIWDNILDEAKSLIPDIEEAFLNALRDDFPAMINCENGQITISAGLPFSCPSDWIWATVNLEKLLEDLVDPDFTEEEDRKAAAAILRKWADKIDLTCPESNSA